MFDNVGGKLKTVAKVEMIIGIVASVILGFTFLTGDRVFAGLLIVIVGVLSSWFGSLVIYGVGQAVENSETILYSTRTQTNSEVNKSKMSSSPAKLEHQVIDEMAAQKEANGEWHCECGRVNKKYVSTCVCGKSRK